MRELRIRFSKTGVAKYISHLDLMRCFSRAMVRAEIPLWYTEGFNPRPYMNFSMPLSLGVEGLQECVDIRMEGDMEDAEVAARLSATMPPDIHIQRVAPPVHKMSEIAASFYSFTVEQTARPAEELAKAFREEAQKPSLPVYKSAKRGREKIQKEINLAEYLEDFTAEAREDGSVRMTVLLPSSNQFGVNPKLLLNKFLEDTGVEPERVRVVREALFCNDHVPFD